MTATISLPEVIVYVWVFPVFGSVVVNAPIKVDNAEFSKTVDADNAIFVGAKLGSDTVPLNVANPCLPAESSATALIVTGKPTNKALTSAATEIGNVG